MSNWTRVSTHILGAGFLTSFLSSGCFVKEWIHYKAIDDCKISRLYSIVEEIFPCCICMLMLYWFSWCHGNSNCINCNLLWVFTQLIQFTWSYLITGIPHWIARRMEKLLECCFCCDSGNMIWRDSKPNCYCGVTNQEWDGLVCPECLLDKFLRC